MSHNRALHDYGSFIVLRTSVYHASRDRGLTIALRTIVACVSHFALMTQTDCPIITI